MIRYLLEGQGFDTRGAADGVEGLRLARESNPDLIITDVAMPKMDGIELARRLHEDVRLAHIPIIFLTARSVQVATSDSAAPSVSVLIKPVNIDNLLAVIRQLIRAA